MAFVCIRRYNTYVPAHISLAKLREAGLEAHLQDEHTVTVDPLLNLAVGGIKLFVPNEQVEAAEKILNELPKTDNIC
ncbi:MAG: DUF2007 domain-containing protein [Bacteroidetes bacterium]|nr:DUF2007 domain-containing protein [Bacteroidota bacterium]